MNTNLTQAQRVLEYMREYGSITQLEALQELGVMRKRGYNIIGERVEVKNRNGESFYIKRYREGEDNG